MSENPHLEDLKQDLEDKTGLSLNIDAKTGHLDFDRSKGSKPLIRRDENGRKIGSRTARKMLIKAIKDKRVLVVKDNQPNGSGTRAGSLEMDYDVTDAQVFMAGASSELNPTTMGYAMVFIHEIDHTALGRGGSDPRRRSEYDYRKGPVVRKMNRVRKQLGEEYGSRESYDFIRDEKNERAPQHIPFSKQVKRTLLRNLKGGKRENIDGMYIEN